MRTKYLIGQGNDQFLKPIFALNLKGRKRGKEKGLGDAAKKNAVTQRSSPIVYMAVIGSVRTVSTEAHQSNQVTRYYSLSKGRLVSSASKL